MYQFFYAVSVTTLQNAAQKWREPFAASKKAAEAAFF
jgi:hypothetical protein